MKNFQSFCFYVSGALYLVGYILYIKYIKKDRWAKPLWSPWLTAKS
ncbi:MAG: hypothetical protein PHS62_01105 [Patescibacteria group bacterium]|nr:hypothetical protein [Patescibacteria group bacterium]